MEGMQVINYSSDELTQSESVIAEYYRRPEDLEVPVQKREESRFQRARRIAFSPLRSFYTYRGKKQVAHYSKRFALMLLQDDGTIDRRAKRDLERGLADRLVEKVHHYDEEGVKYLKIYAVCALVIATVLVGGTVITASAASGGTMTAAGIGAGVGVAAGTALVTAGFTAALFAYRVDAKRKHVLKGTAGVFLIRFQRDQQHKQEREVAQLMAQLAFKTALESKFGGEADQYRINPRKYSSLVELIVESMIENEGSTKHLRHWTGFLQAAVKEGLRHPAPQLESLQENARHEADMRFAEIELPMTEDEAQEIHGDIKKSVVYQATKLWLAPETLEEPSAPIATVLKNHLWRKSPGSDHISVRMRSAAEELKALLHGVPLSTEAELNRLKVQNKVLRKKYKSTRADLTGLQREVAELRQLVEYQAAYA